MNESVCRERRLALLLPDGSWEWVEADESEDLTSVAEERYEAAIPQKSREVSEMPPGIELEVIPASDAYGSKKCVRIDYGEPEMVSDFCRCGSTEWRYVEIHGGESTRKDCRQCDRTAGFSRWYGREIEAAQTLS